MPSGAALAPRVGLIPSLDGLRALSILFVFWAHAGLPGGVRGGTGVTIFFFLSGYLITTLMRVEFDRSGTVSLKDFYLRRVFRIFPPMYLAIALGVILTLGGLLATDLTTGGLSATALFYTNYWIIFTDGVGVPEGLGVLWSLAVEEHYYLAFPFVYLAMQKFIPDRQRQVAILITICAIVCVWRTWLFLGADVAEPRVYYATDTRMDSILFGAILALWRNPVYGEIHFRRPGTLPLLASVAAVIFFAVSFGPATINYTIGYTIQGLTLMPIFAYVILAPKSWIGRVLNWKPLAFIGVLSYTAYLVHSQFLHAVRNVTEWPVAFEALIAGTMTFAFAWGVYHLVERPVAKLRKRISHSGETVDRMPSKQLPAEHDSERSPRRNDVR